MSIPSHHPAEAAGERAPALGPPPLISSPGGSYRRTGGGGHRMGLPVVKVLVAFKASCRDSHCQRILF